MDSDGLHHVGNYFKLGECDLETSMATQAEHREGELKKSVAKAMDNDGSHFASALQLWHTQVENCTVELNRSVARSMDSDGSHLASNDSESGDVDLETSTRN